MNYMFARIPARFVYSVLTLMFGFSVVVQAQTTITTTNLGANQVTLNLTSPATGRGYFTLLTGSATCGTAAQTLAGQDSAGAAASRRGSLPLTASITGSYTVRNLAASTAYKVCFTPDGVASPIHTTVATLAAASLAGGTWQTVGPAGAAPSYESGQPSFAFAPDGTPYVAFEDLHEDNLEDILNLGKLTVLKYTGSAWVVVGMSHFSDGMVDFPSLTFAPDGTPYIAFEDDTNNGNGAARVMKFDGSAWVNVGNPGFASGAELHLAFGPDGGPYLSFLDYSYNFAATVVKFDGSTWVTVGSPAFTNESSAIYSSFAFAPDGTPYFSYSAGDRGSIGPASVMKYDGTAWVPVGILGLPGTSGFSGGYVTFTSLAFAADGTPYIAYQDINNSGTTVMKYDGSAWVVVGSKGFSGVTVSGTSLAFSPDGTPYIAYANSSSGLLTVMKF